jgi:NADPH-dependent F420 reductase
MHIAILGGTGPQGKGLGFRFALAGHQVGLGSRNADRAHTAAEELHPRLPMPDLVTGGTNAEVVGDADITVLSVPYEGQIDLLDPLADALRGRILVSCVNPLAFDADGPHALDVLEGSAAEQAALALPETTVVAAFHHLSAPGLLEEGDVHASCAYSLAIIGEVERSMALLMSADALELRGHTDLQAAAIVLLTRSFLRLPIDPAGALGLLQSMDLNSPLDLGFNLEHHTLVALAHLLMGDRSASAKAAEVGLAAARARAGLRSEVRLELVHAMAMYNEAELRTAITRAAATGDLALLTVADALGPHLDLVPDVPPELSLSVGRWRKRWLPILRAQLGRGNVPSAHVAARLLDEHGTLEDVPRLRAFEKTYLKRRPIGLGRALARRVSPKLELQDLGRVVLRIGDRLVPLTRMRRKPASLLMYLVTKPNFTATREQVLDELWPDADPVSAMNSLNQSLYFLRRDLEPWYEDDKAVDYVAYEGEVLWLDHGLVNVESARFLAEARNLLKSMFTFEQAVQLLGLYSGQFSPEFEYEEWAMGWRARVHASFLEFAYEAADRFIATGNLKGACEVASTALRVDPTASDIEERLIWLYARLGATSAAASQYVHFEARCRADGVEPPTLADLVAASRPTRR